MKETLPEFTGKAVSFVLVGEDDSRLLVDAHFETQAGRVFVIGTTPSGASKKDWLEGLDQALAWERVQEYIVFESADHYFKRLTKQSTRKDHLKK